ncbi:MAG: hypothetical protein LBS84_09920 [Clostridiales bacterium]|jgi:hypothetical protein|nr:hypothetical protein [Clostridiales bacterium]
MNKRLCLITIPFILCFSYMANGAEAAKTDEGIAMKEGSVLSGEYPRLSIKGLAVRGEEGSGSAEWEIHFALGENPEQWDRVLVGELLTDSVKRSPISWSLTDESGDVWPPNTSSSALRMDWLSPDTLGWTISASEEMPFETLKNKRFTIKLRAITDPSRGSGKEGFLNGTFINCYYKHALKHYNSTYTGTEAQNASTAFKRVSLYENGIESPADDSLVAGEDSMLDTYDLRALEYKEPEEFGYYMITTPSATPAATDDYQDYRDLYVEGEEFIIPATEGTEGVSEYPLEVTPIPDYAYGLYAYDYNGNTSSPEFDPGSVSQSETSVGSEYYYSESPADYDPEFEFDSTLEYPAVSENTGAWYQPEPPYAQAPAYYESNWGAPMPIIPDPPSESADNNIVYGSTFGYPQDDDYYTGETTEEYPAEAPIYPTEFKRAADITPQYQTAPEEIPPYEAASEAVLPSEPDAAAPGVYSERLELYNYPSDLSVSEAPTVEPKTRSSVPREVSYDDESDSKSNPTTWEKNLLRDICVYFFLCVSISLFFTQKKQPRR